MIKPDEALPIFATAVLLEKDCLLLEGDLPESLVDTLK